MTDLIFARGGVADYSGLHILPAGDVGHTIEISVPDLSIGAEIGDSLSVELLSGQELEFTVDAMKMKKAGERRVAVLSGTDAVCALSRAAPSREQIFVSMTSGEYAEYLENTRNLRPHYDIHVMIGDQFGRRGYSSMEVARALALKGGLDDVVPAVVPQWIRQVVCRPSVSYLSAILALFRLQEPIVWVRDNVLFLMDRTLLHNFAEDAPTVSNGLLASRVVCRPALSGDGSLMLKGGLGKFRPDKHQGKVWTAPFSLASALSSGDIKVKSRLLKSMLSLSHCFGGYETCDRVERGESEIHVIKEVWLRDVIGNRQRMLFSQESVYRTQPCENWSSTSSCCNFGLRCNGRGTAVSCGWYNPMRGVQWTKAELIRCEEMLHLYEHTSWEVETPREYASHSVISASAWVRRCGEGGDDGKSRLVKVWLDPIEYQIRTFCYDRVLGTLITQTTQKRAAVFSNTPDCNFVAGSSSVGGDSVGCELGRETCDHFNTPSGRCLLGLECNEYGRLATCSQYTGTARTCSVHRSFDGTECCYRADCPDCDLKWRRLGTVKSPSEVSEDAVIKTSLVGLGGSQPAKDGRRSAPDGVDPECIIHQEIIRHDQVDAMTYRRTVHTLRLASGVLESRTESHNVPASSVPSHPIEMRKMRVSSQLGGSGDSASSTPQVVRSDSNLVDWDDADNVAERLHENLSSRGIEDTYVIPGEVFIQPGTPILPPVECDSELPMAPDGAGAVERCSISTSTEESGKGFARTELRVRY
ncbi:hypothetical protein J7M28_10240 [bacterium]|nr:hypothetical protein [bacterium]